MQRSTGWILVLLGALTAGVAIASVVQGMGGEEAVPLYVMLILVGSAVSLGGVFCLLFLSTEGRAGGTGASSGNGRFKPHELEDHTVDGLPCQIFFKPRKTGKNGHPSALMISVRTELPTTLQFNAENWFDRMCKTVGIAREHQTGDARFDDLLYVRAPLESYAERYLADPARREALVTLKEWGFHEIKLTQTEAQAQWSGFEPDVHDREGLVDDVARRLHTLTANLPAPDPQLDEPPWSIDWNGPLWLFVLLYALTFGLAFWFQPVRERDLIEYSLLVYAASWFVLAWFGAFLLRGHSTSHDRWIVLVAVGLVAMLLGSIGTVSAVNALADGAQPLERRVMVIDKRISRGKKSTTYYLCVPAWDREGEKVEFTVSSSDYNRAVMGKSEFILVTSPGALGIEWLHSKQLRL